MKQLCNVEWLLGFRSRYRHSSGSNLVSQSQADQYCRMNKSNSTGNQQVHPYGSPLHSYVSSQDLFARYFLNRVKLRRCFSFQTHQKSNPNKHCSLYFDVNLYQSLKSSCFFTLGKLNNHIIAQNIDFV